MTGSSASLGADGGAGRGGGRGGAARLGASKSAFGTRAAGRPAEMTGRSGSSSEPSAAGKSEGNGVRSGFRASARAGVPSAEAGVDRTEGRSAKPGGVGDRGAAGGLGLTPPSVGGSAASGLATMNECPHLGHRIFKPAGGTRRSSIWYGALHDSHSTLSIAPIRPRERTTTASPQVRRWTAGEAARAWACGRSV